MPKVSWKQDDYNESRAGFEPIPKGVYPCIIESIEQKDTSSGSGYYFETVFEVTKGDYARRKLWAILNVKNDSEMAEQIGREQFNSLCKATGKERVKDTQELVGKHVACIVVIEPGKGSYPDKNKVTGYMSIQALRDSRGGSNAAASSEEEPRRGAATKTAAKGATKTADKQPVGDDFDDDIPF